MKKAILALSLAVGTAFSAQADVVLTTTAGTDPYVGPGFTASSLFDFESATPRWDRAIFTDSSAGVRARPYGTSGGYASVGPTDGSPGTFDLTGLGPVRRLSFVWGSVDSYNTLEVLGAGGAVIKSFIGNDVFNPANGNQTDPNTNPLVTLTITGADYGNVTGLRFSSTQNAFEYDNLAVGVPEPATWAMMIGGFGMLGFAARRRGTAKVVTA